MSEPTAKKGNTMYWIIGGFIALVIIGVSVYFFWYKPNYIDKAPPANALPPGGAPPVKKTVDIANPALLTSLAAAPDAATVSRILRAVA